VLVHGILPGLTALVVKREANNVATPCKNTASPKKQNLAVLASLVISTHSQPRDILASGTTADETARGV